MADQNAYALACIGLYSRLWAELERLGAADAQPGLRSQIIRLEIHLVMQCCDTGRWRALMSAPQRLSLQQTLADVLSLLGTSGCEIRVPAGASAQDRLLDAVLEHCAALCAVTPPAQIDRILVLSADETGSMWHECDEDASDGGSGHGPWTGRQASRGRQDLR
jgi:hypothetical protein